VQPHPAPWVQHASLPACSAVRAQRAPVLGWEWRSPGWPGLMSNWEPLRFPPHTAGRLFGTGAGAVTGFGPPPHSGDDTGFHHLQTVEEAGNLLKSTQPVQDAGSVRDLRPLLTALGGLDAVIDDQVATGGHGVEQPFDDRPRLLVLGVAQ